MKLLTLMRDWLILMGVFARELAKSVVDVVRTVLNPGRVRHSAIVAVPLTVSSDAGIALFANLITLTPGTTSLFVDRQSRLLYVHVMNLSDSSVSDMKTAFEPRVIAVLP